MGGNSPRRNSTVKPLENRSWYVLVSLAVSALLTFGLWKAAALPISLSAGTIFMLATLGLWQGVTKLLAVLLIKAKPSLGAIE
jgi:Co/Zn/Cd efflux system component